MGEITSHKYNFDRQQENIETLASITKAEFQDHFERIFFSNTSKRLDLQLTSEAHKSEQDTFKASN
jgi:secreted Zn-dependent insulinase-like peptidase